VVDGTRVRSRYEDEVREFVAAATPDELIERIVRMELRLRELDARLREVKTVVEGAGL